MKKALHGFTIVELLIVIVVIAILATISIIAYRGIQDRARTAAHQAAANQVAKQIMSYALQENGESISLGDLIGYTEEAGDIPLLKPLVGTPDITMYAVYGVVDMSGHYSILAALSPTLTGQMFRLQTAATGVNQMSYRIDTSAQAASSGFAGFRIPGNNVIGWLQVSSNATARAIGYNQAAAQSTGALAAHSGWNFTGLSMTSSSDGVSRVSLVFNAAHDEATRAQVIGWLAEKYGVSL